MRFIRTAQWSPVLVLAVLFLGCDGSNQVTTSGEVTLDGKPLPSGLIHFEPELVDSPSQSTAIENGSYRFEDANALAPGKYKVSIRSTPPSSDADEEDPDKMMEMAAQASAFKEPILPRFNTKTELTAEVTPAQANTISFQVFSK